MKNIFKLSALFCAMTLLATGCTQDETLEPQVKPAAVGDEIIFGSRAGFENGNPDTRTVYSGETYKVGEVTFERIDWVDGEDAVEIYSPHAGGPNPSHYLVMDASKADDTDETTTDTEDEGYLTKIGDAALSWGTGDPDNNGAHTFYAMYPSSQMATIAADNTLAQGIKMNKAVLTGIVPQAQQAIAVETVGTTHYAKPNMTYAYMAAKAVATPGANVTLNFVPVVTALEIELQAQNIDVPIKELIIEGTGIAGTFTADLSKWADTYPTCEFPSEDAFARDAIIFSLGQTITVKANQSLVFTVFLRPGVDYENITVGFSETGAGYLRKTIGNETTKVTIKKNAKNIVSNVYLPKKAEDLVIDASKWMEQLENKMDMARLSLPGAGGAFTSGAAAGYKQQTLDFEGLWKAGVRAFEVSVDRVDQDPNSVDEASSLGSQPVICNGVSVGVSLEDVVKNLVDKVSSGTETAMLILTYQPLGASPNRNGERFAYNLRKFYDTLIGGTVKTANGHTISESDFVLYSPSTILGEKENALNARGKVMIVTRPTQHDETDNGGNDSWDNIKSALSGTKILALNGCGTAKDRWGKRGYLVRENKALDIVAYGTAISTSIPCVEYYLKGDGRTSYDANVSKSSSDFTYETDEDYRCWYQDWARVVSVEHLEGSGTYHDFTFSPGGILDRRNYRWHESLQEKKDDVEKTFGLALKSTPETKIVYINSLCGYLVDNDYTPSYITFPDTDNMWNLGGNSGGASGNVEALAVIMNEFLNEIVTQAGMEQATGPTGIVLMDFVTANSPAIGAIVSNNFKFTTTGGGSGSGSGSGEGGGQTGGGSGEGEGGSVGGDGDDPTGGDGI